MLWRRESAAQCFPRKVVVVRNRLGGCYRANSEDWKGWVEICGKGQFDMICNWSPGTGGGWTYRQSWNMVVGWMHLAACSYVNRKPCIASRLPTNSLALGSQAVSHGQRLY